MKEIKIVIDNQPVSITVTGDETTINGLTAKNASVINKLAEVLTSGHSEQYYANRELLLAEEIENLRNEINELEEENGKLFSRINELEDILTDIRYMANQC